MHDYWIVLVQLLQLSFSVTGCLPLPWEQLVIFLQHLEQLYVRSDTVHGDGTIHEKAHFQLSQEEVLLGLLRVDLQHVFAVVDTDLSDAITIILAYQLLQIVLPGWVVGLKLQEIGMHSEWWHHLQSPKTLFIQGKSLWQLHHTVILCLPGGIGCAKKYFILECISNHCFQFFIGVVEEVVMGIEVALLFLHLW